MKKRISKRRMICIWKNYNKKLDAMNIKGKQREDLLNTLWLKYRKNFVNDDNNANVGLMT